MFFTGLLLSVVCHVCCVCRIVSAVCSILYLICMLSIGYSMLYAVCCKHLYAVYSMLYAVYYSVCCCCLSSAVCCVFNVCCILFRMLLLPVVYHTCPACCSRTLLVYTHSHLQGMSYVCSGVDSAACCTKHPLAAATADCAGTDDILRESGTGWGGGL